MTDLLDEDFDDELTAEDMGTALDQTTRRFDPRVDHPAHNPDMVVREAYLALEARNDRIRAIKNQAGAAGTLEGRRLSQLCTLALHGDAEALEKIAGLL